MTKSAILFICRGNLDGKVSPIILNQANSLKKIGFELDFYIIQGRGIIAYFRHIFLLRQFIKRHSYNIYHAHYSLSAFTAGLAGCDPLVVSLMGSDVYENRLTRFIIKVFNSLFWTKLIVKSEHMKEKMTIQKCEIIPNGVNLSEFITSEKKLSKTASSPNPKKNIVFLANPNRKVKNFPLAQSAYNLINDKNITLQVVYNKEISELPQIYNTADVILLTSLHEGSPNVVKEAMACNCPVVSTDVGDVRWLFGTTEGYYLTGFDPAGVAEKLKLALDFGKRTKGRERILELGLDSDSVAERLKSVYTEVLSSKRKN